MEQLPSYYTRGVKIQGIFHHTLIKRTAKKAMYKVEFEPPYTNERSFNCFEVFQIKEQKECDVPYKDPKTGLDAILHYTAKELTPSDKAFGRYAWCPSTSEKAEHIYETMHIPEAQVDDNGEEIKRKRGRPKKNP
jgi:hypothetical protein